MSSPRQIVRRIGIAVGMLGLALLIVHTVLAASISNPIGNTFASISPALVLDANDRPVLSYSVTSVPNTNLVYCNDLNCDGDIGGPESNVTMFMSSITGRETSVVLDSLGYPVLTFSPSNTMDLVLVHCDDPMCLFAGASTFETQRIIDSTGDVGRYSAVQLDGSGYPVISYYDATNNDLKVAHCNDMNCDPAVNGAESIRLLDSANVGSFTSLVLDASGYPAISYYDIGNEDLKLVHCNDANCDPAVNGAESIQTLDSAGSVGTYLSLRLDAAGYPVVAYYSATDTSLKLIRCNDANCNPAVNGTESIVTVDNAASVGEYASLVLDASDNPIMSYYDSTNGDLKLAQCDDPACGSPDIQIVESTGNVGTYTRIALDSNGIIVILYKSVTANALRLARVGISEPPSAPTNLSAVVESQTSVTLEWDDNSTDETSFQVRYGIQIGNFFIIKTIYLPAGTTSYSVLNLRCGRVHGFQVRAFRSTDEVASSWEIVTNITTDPCGLNAPTSVGTPSSTHSTVTLNWNDNSVGESGFEVYRYNSAIQDVDLIITTPPDTGSYIDSQLRCDASYNYFVRAVRNTDGAASNLLSINAQTQACSQPPLGPQNLAAAALSQTTTALTWTDSFTDERRFIIEQSTDLSTWKLIGVGANTQNYTAQGLLCGTTYHYRISAVFNNSSTSSAYSNATSATTDACSSLSAPSDLNATTISGSQIDLIWADNSSDESSFGIERSPNGSTGWTEIASNSANDTTFPNTSLSCETTYYYRVRVHRSGDNQYSTYSNIANATTAACPPAAPSNLNATTASQTQIDLTWTDNFSDETSFRIERSPNGSTGWTEIASNDADDTTYSDTGLNCGTTYYYRVRAHRSGDNQYSTYSNTDSAITSACPPPTAPSSLNATAVSATQIDLTWTDNSSDETSFRIERSPNGSSGWTEIASNSAGDTTYSNSSLSCGITYYYRVRAHRSGDNLYSDYSIIANTTTVACPPTAPSSLNATAASQTQVDLTWTDNSSDETSFKIERSPNGSTGWTEIAANNADDSTYSDSGVACGTFYYRVRAYRSGDNQHSTYSNIDSATSDTCPPIAPTNLNAIVRSASHIDLWWTDNSNDETEFRVDRSPNGVDSWVYIGAYVPITPYFSDTGLTCNTTYYYRVRAYRASDNKYSDYTSVINATTNACPSSPSSLNTTAVSQTQIDLTWTDNSNETSFKIERSPNGSTGWTEIASNAANDTTYSNTSLTCGIYYYRVRAHRSGDNQYSDYSNTAYEVAVPCGIFADVPTPGKEFMQPYIEVFYLAGITTGCSVTPTNYCPEQPVLRSSMAVFLLRALNYPNLPHTPPTAAGIFDDVPTPGKEWMEPWIEEFYNLGITGGCGVSPARFCPENSVTRAAMAVFILRAIEGPGYTPAPSPNIFSDLPVAGKEWMEPWVNEFYNRGFTTGCNSTPLSYCPENAVTRGAMAVFILRAFDNLPKP